jgi:hypothetical protein
MAWNNKNAFLAALGRLLGLEEIAQGVLNADQNALRVESSPPTTGASGTAAAIAAVDAAPDCTEVITYLDVGDATDRRIDTIVRSSASLALSYTTTYSYAGSAGDYYMNGSVRS